MDDEELRRRLQSLPQEAAPPFAWSEIRERREQRRAAQSRRRPTMLYVAASVACITLGALAIWQRFAASPTGSRVASPTFVATAAGDAGAIEASVPTASNAPALVNVDRHVLTAALEDRIAWFDDALTEVRAQDASSPRVRELESTRRQLVDSLQRVRYAEVLAAQIP